MGGIEGGGKARDMCRIWIEDGTAINIRLDMAMIGNRGDAAELLGILVKHAKAQVEQHYARKPDGNQRPLWKEIQEVEESKARTWAELRRENHGVPTLEELRQQYHEQRDPGEKFGLRPGDPLFAEMSQSVEEEHAKARGLAYPPRKEPPADCITSAFGDTHQKAKDDHENKHATGALTEDLARELNDPYVTKPEYPHRAQRLRRLRDMLASDVDLAEEIAIRDKAEHNSKSGFDTLWQYLDQGEMHYAELHVRGWKKSRPPERAGCLGLSPEAQRYIDALAAAPQMGRAMVPPSTQQDMETAHKEAVAMTGEAEARAKEAIQKADESAGCETRGTDGDSNSPMWNVKGVPGIQHGPAHDKTYDEEGGQAGWAETPAGGKKG